MSDVNEKTEQPRQPPEKKKGGMVKIIASVAIIAAVFFLARHFGLTEHLNLEGVQVMQEWFRGLGVLGWLVFILLFILVAVFMLPAFFFTLAAGIAFGPVLGAILSLVGATFGAAAAFIVARYVARDTIVNKFQNNPFFAKIEKGLKENGTSFLILTRLVPAFPYNVQNYVYGLTPIKLGTFFYVSFITMAPGAFIYAFMAGQIVAGQPIWMLMIMFAIAGVLLFLVSLIPKYIARKKGINLKENL
ncbi:MAG: TVP38/TMEM64 family protein [Treponema sp.]|nr:TVP38/TMEM64 family protein [Treponema sp.]